MMGKREEKQAINQSATFANEAPLIIWDIDAVKQSAVYSELEVEDIDWHEDEDTPGSAGDEPAHPCKKQDKPSVSTPVVVVNSPSHLQTKETKSSGFDYLSDELVLKIFGYLKRKYLARCTRVCKHWNRLGYDDSLWKRVDMTKSVISVGGLLGKVLHRGVEHLLLKLANVCSIVCSKNCPGDRRYRKHPRSHKRRSMICSENFSVKCLNATLCKFEEDYLSYLLKKCKSLKILSLEGCTVSDADMRAISENPSLEQLNLLMCTGVTSFGIDVLSRNCQRLKSFNLGWVKLTEEDLLKVSTRLSLLEELNVSGMKEAMTDEVVISLMNSCESLVNLDLSDSLSIGTPAIEAIIEHNKLKKLSLSRCYTIPASVLSRITEVKSLEHLQLFGFLNKTVITEIQKIRPQLCINSEMFSTIARPNAKDVKKLL